MPPIPSHRTVLELPCTHALNLCDVAGTSPDALATPAQVVETLCRQTACDAEVGSFDRVYVGSYLCDRMFLSLSGEFLRAARDLACSMGAALTLVAPIFGQRAADAGLARVKELLSPATDHAERLPFTELVVNDQALAQHMGAWLEQVYPDIAKRPRLVRGRLMARCARDPRYGAPAAPQPVPLDARAADLERAAWHPCLMEVDPFAPLIDASPLEGALPLALHLPHAVLTTGHICKAASIGVPLGRSFRADAPCRRQCLGGIDVFECPGLSVGPRVYLTQQGRAVFFEKPGCRVVGAQPARIVWSPAEYGCPTPQEGGSPWEQC